MDKQLELKGLVTELIQEEYKGNIEELQAKAEAQDELNIKTLEENTVMKAQIEAMQDKEFKMTQNTGENTYVFKGYDTKKPARNFKMALTEDQREEAAGSLLKMWKAAAGQTQKELTTGNTGVYSVPQVYGSALLGLAELSSFSLANCRVINYPGEILYLTAKGTRTTTTDAQQFGTANAASDSTLGRLTFTIDKRVGGYETLWNNVLRQQNFDVIGEFVEPIMAEAIGQKFDGYMFNASSEFTTNITTDGTAGATFSGTIGDTSITYNGLVDVETAVNQERGVANCVWCMTRSVYGRIRKLTDTNSRPLIERAMEGPLGHELFGYPLHIVPALATSPADGAVAIAFGSPQRYILGINQGILFHVNPIVEQKEGKTQFIIEATADGNIEDAEAWATYARSDA